MRVLIAGCLVSWSSAAMAANYVEGEVLIRYKATSSPVQIAGHLSGRKVSRLSTVDEAGRELRVRLPAGESVESAVRRLSSDAAVEAVQPNFIYRISAPNDTYYGSLWGLRNSGQTVNNSAFGPDLPTSGSNPGTSGRDMNMELAWSKITDCGSVVVAVVDTGINYDHEDLAANMWAGGAGVPHHGWNTFAGNDDPFDDNGHGTHVAGTIGAVGNNGLGTVGVCWGVKLMAIKAMGADGSGTSATVASGVSWAVSHGAKVINLSLGTSGNDPTLNNAIEAARVAGVVVVSAAGNDGTNNDSSPRYPCGNRKANTVCVAALTQSYGLASFSNYGASSVDVGAPGTNIVSTWPFNFTRTTDNFSTGWTASRSAPDSWNRVNTSLGWGMFIPQAALTGGTYSNNQDDHVYKSFNLAGAAREVRLEIWVNRVLGTGDTLGVYYQSGTGDPAPGGTLLKSWTNADNTGASSAAVVDYDITPNCQNATCSIGFRLVTDSTSVGSAGFLNFGIVKVIDGDSGYNVIQGTSMAAPHVAGLAAMIFAYQPTYTAAEVVNSIKGGGRATTSLAGKTTTGKAIDAAGALAYIQAPTGVAATAGPSASP